MLPLLSVRLPKTATLLTSPISVEGDVSVVESGTLVALSSTADVVTTTGAETLRVQLSVVLIASKSVWFAAIRASADASIARRST